MDLHEITITDEKIVYYPNNFYDCYVGRHIYLNAVYLVRYRLDIALLLLLLSLSQTISLLKSYPMAAVEDYNLERLTHFTITLTGFIAHIVEVD